MVIRPNHCRNRSANNRCKFRIQFCYRICKLFHQPVIAAKNGIHITKSSTEQCTFTLKPSWLIKSTDISGTATGITNDDNSAKFIQYRHRTGLIRSKRCQIFSQSSHYTIPPSVPQTVYVHRHNHTAAVLHSRAHLDTLYGNIRHLFQSSD